MLSIHKAALEREYRLFPFYQTGEQGLAFHHHYQPEHNKRIRQVIVTPPAEIPKGGGGSQANNTIPRTPGFTDLRFHKEGRNYETVSPQHFIGEDSVLDPAQKHSLNDGYTEAIRLEALLVANGDTTSRIVMTIFGGEYTENLILTSSRIDIECIGKVTMIGLLTVDTTCAVLWCENLRVTNPAAGCIVVTDVIDAFVSLAPPLVFQFCTFDGNPVIGSINRRTLFDHCTTTTNGSGARLTVHYAIDTKGKTEFHFCKLYSRLDGNNRPIDFAINCTAQDATGLFFATTQDTGVIFRDCDIFGSIGVEGWFVDVVGGTGYGGVKLPASPRKFFIRSLCASIFGPNPINADCTTTLDNVVVVSSIIGIFSDRYVANGAALCHLKIRHVDNLLQSVEIPNADAVNQQPSPLVGSGDIAVILSSTTATAGGLAAWSVAPIVQTFIDTSSIVNVPAGDGADLYL